ncbi:MULTISPECIES: hypothetical protein [Rhodococcus]|uniref:Secreted protein n=1 Tax=Rhodococcus jostii TaxID=132919 RepID=A0ABU4CJD3_RHOJO|nr:MULTISPECIES: hypothetical protein [Rhodococcus]MDI9949414.1 hypothetical protein [Rhodococcus sp. IEGM 1305]MDI9976755.1 hypothetical protein [Rhodococcus sp. IEGM 1307]MDV6283578.1 hypothetical protein [Rhodococcus jostii]
MRKTVLFAVFVTAVVSVASVFAAAVGPGHGDGPDPENEVVDSQEPVIGEGRPATTEDFWRDATEGQDLSRPPAVAPGGSAITNATAHGTFTQDDE